MSKIRKNTYPNKKSTKQFVSYRTTDNTIYFMANFNGPLDKYYNIINTYKCLKFSSMKQGFFSNTPFEIPNNITNIEFNDWFNHPIVLTPNLTHVVFGKHYSQPVNSSRKLKYIFFKNIFNHPIIFPKSTEYLDLQIVDIAQFKLTKNLAVLKMNVKNDQSRHYIQQFILNKTMCKLLLKILSSQPIVLPVLSKNLDILTLEFTKQNSYIHFDLPKKIKRIAFSHFIFAKPLILTPNVTHLLFSTYYLSNTFIIEKPINQVYLDADNRKVINNLPNGTKYIGLFKDTDEQTVSNFPSNVETSCIKFVRGVDDFKLSKNISVEFLEKYVNLDFYF